jgi:hypothetical protein
MPSPRKQRYALDFDDVIRRGLMNKANSEELVAGLNESETEEFVSTVVGGTNNDTFIDQEILIYDASTKKIISSGETIDTIGLHSVFVPHITGVKLDGGGATASVSTTENIVVASSSFDLPANCIWVELDVTFSFFLRGATSIVDSMSLLLGDDITTPIGMATSYNGPYASMDDNDSVSVSWNARGLISSGHDLDDPLIINVKAIPNDVIAYRKCITRVGYRQVVASGGAGAKGIPVFLSTPVSMTPLADTTWHEFNLSAHVPAEASAVIIHGAMAQSETNNVYATQLRKAAGFTEYLLVATTTNNDEDDKDTAVNQGIFPYKTLGAVRTIEHRTTAGGYERLELLLIGYVT